jgi:hypothetical protein
MTTLWLLENWLRTLRIVLKWSSEYGNRPWVGVNYKEFAVEATKRRVSSCLIKGGQYMLIVNLCKSDFSVAHGGFNDITRHDREAFHISRDLEIVIALRV